MRTAIEHPELVSAVVTVDRLPSIPLGPGPIPLEQRAEIVETNMAPAIMAMSDEEWHKVGRAQVDSMVTDRDRRDAIAELSGFMPMPTVRRYMLEYYASDITGGLAELDHPLLVLAAANDTFENFGFTRDLMCKNWESHLSEHPNPKIVYFDGCLHFLTEDDPEGVDLAIAAFIDGL